MARTGSVIAQTGLGSGRTAVAGQGKLSQGHVATKLVVGREQCSGSSGCRWLRLGSGSERAAGATTAVTQGSVVVCARLVQAVAQVLIQAAQGCGKGDSGLRFGREKMK